MPRPRHTSDVAVLEAINAWIAEKGYPPTIEELRKHLNVGSTRTVLRYLQSLEREGMIERWAGARGLKVRRRPEGQPSTEPIPIAGRAPAGSLMVADTNIEGWIRLPREFVRPTPKDYFLLRIRGNSMNLAAIEGERIQDGDLVLVRRQATAMNGDIVVALLDGEATVKRLKIGRGYVGLKPDSSEAGHDSYLLKQGFRVQGVVKRVFKRGSQLLEVDAE